MSFKKVPKDKPRQGRRRGQTGACTPDRACTRTLKVFARSVRFGSLADIPTVPLQGPLSANSGHNCRSQRNQKRFTKKTARKAASNLLSTTIAAYSRQELVWLRGSSTSRLEISLRISDAISGGTEVKRMATLSPACAADPRTQNFLSSRISQGA
jgi:hypothetical protein